MRAVLLAKMFLDRREHRGACEFRFRWHPAFRGWQRLSVAARDTSFRTDLLLRTGTSDAWVFEQVFCNNDYNLRRLPRWNDIEQTYHNLAAEGSPLILDLGANVGMASIYFAKNWPAARILAVEPSQQNYDVLCRNVASLKQVMPLKAAVSAIDGFVRITNVEGHAWAHRTAMATRAAVDTVPAKSVASLIASAGDEQRCYPFICKIDIEGFESHLFSSNTDWIRLFPVIIIELHDWMLPKQRTSASFLREISNHDRDFMYIGENVFSISNDI